MNKHRGNSGFLIKGLSLGLAASFSLGALAQVTTNQPPRISDQQSPQSVVVVAGTSASFNASASGTVPFTYQWQLNSTNIPYGTNRTQLVSRAGDTNEGDYVVVVSNPYGSATSRVARLTVIPPPTQLQARYYTNGGLRLPYRLFVPPNYTPTEQYPLVLFMHGAGEVGSDNLMQLSVHPQALAFVSYARQESSPTFLVAPQCPSGNYWSSPTILPRLNSLLDALAQEFSIDTNRFYITGLSMGGYGCWALLDLNPERFAAAIPICGGGYPAGSARYAQVPIWNFHAANDGTVAVMESRNMVNALRAFGSHLVYTEYTSGGHGVWPMAYATPGLVEWTMAQTRGRPMVDGPLVQIEQGTTFSNRTAAAGLLRLSGTASFVDENVSRVSWTNLLGRTSGTAVGSNPWSIAALPLVNRSTNTVIITAATRSFAPTLSGSTTFSDALFVKTGPPLWLQLERTQLGIRLSAPENTMPLILQSSTDPGATGWEETDFNPLVPIDMPAKDTMRFYRLVDPGF